MASRSALHLDQADVLNVVGSIYDAALSPELWSRFMSEALGLFNAIQGTVVLVDQKNPVASIVQTPGFNPEYLPEFQARRDTEDYWWLAARDKPTGAVFIGTELISVRDMRERAIYHEVAKHLDSEFVIGGVIDKRPEGGLQLL
jgi:hypothetical protein